MKSISTQSELAKALKVSRETICRAFSNHPKIGKKTQKRILDYAREIGYKPNSAARIMQGQGKFGSIAYVNTSDWYAGERLVAGNVRRFMPAVTREASAAGIFVIYEPFDARDGSLCEFPRIFTERCIDGIVAEYSQSIPDELDELLHNSGVPIVWLNHRKTPEQNMYSGMFFNPDEVDGGRKLAKHLIELGHKRIGFFTANTAHFSAEDRYKGIVLETDAAGLTPPVCIRMQHVTCLPDPKELEKFLSPEIGLSAVICYNRIQANYLLTQMYKRHRVGPEDLSICCFSEEMDEDPLLEITRYVSPDNRVGAESFKALHHLIQNNIRTPEETTERSFKGKLVVGTTTAKPGRIANCGLRNAD